MQIDVIDAQKTAMIVVDMQNDFVAVGAAMETPAARAVVRKLAEALDIVLREWGVDTVIISETTTENCCLATARDAMFRNYRVVFLSDATATYDYPDRGFGAMPATEVHHATLVILAASTAHVMSVKDMSARISRQA